MEFEKKKKQTLKSEFHLFADIKVDRNFEAKEISFFLTIFIQIVRVLTCNLLIDLVFEHINKYEMFLRSNKRQSKEDYFFILKNFMK